MKIEEIYKVFHNIFAKGGLAGYLNFTVMFQDPTNRINLPTYISDKKDKKGNNLKQFAYYPTDTGINFLVMSRPCLARHYSSCMLRAMQGERNTSFKYPNVFISFALLDRDNNLLEQPHRLYSGFFTLEDKNIWVEWNGKKFFDEIKDIYSNDIATRTKKVLLFSPVTILFGGYGSHAGLDCPIKMNALVEMECNGTAVKDDNGKVYFRKNTGAYMPVIPIRDDKIPREKKTKISEDDTAEKPKSPGKTSEEGWNTVPCVMEENVGAVYLKNITLVNRLKLSQLSSVIISKNQDENANVRTYLLALALRVWWLGHYFGYDHFSGRDIISDGPPKFSLECNSQGIPDIDFNLEKVRPIIESFGNKTGYNTCEQLYDYAIQQMVASKLIRLEKVELIPNDKMEQAALASQRSKKSGKGKKSDV